MRNRTILAACCDPFHRDFCQGTILEVQTEGQKRSHPDTFLRHRPLASIYLAWWGGVEISAVKSLFSNGFQPLQLLTSISASGIHFNSPFLPAPFRPRWVLPACPPACFLAYHRSSDEVGSVSYIQHTCTYTHLVEQMRCACLGISIEIGPCVHVSLSRNTGSLASRWAGKPRSGNTSIRLSAYICVCR